MHYLTHTMATREERKGGKRRYRVSAKQRKERWKARCSDVPSETYYSGVKKCHFSCILYNTSTISKCVLVVIL